MKHWIIILLFMPLFASAQWSNEKFNASFIDHAGMSMMITMGTTAMTQAIFPNFKYSHVVGFAIGIMAGMLKEFSESQPDQIDLVADFTGCCIGFTITLSWEKWRWK